MVARARRRVREHGWTNVEVRRADASRTAHGHAEFDAAVALSSLSAMPDVAAAVGNTHGALRPGGRLFVFDMRLVPTGHAGKRLVTRLQRLVYRATAGFTGADVDAELRRTFDTVEPVPPADEATTSVCIVLATKAWPPASASRHPRAGSLAQAVDVGARAVAAAGDDADARFPLEVLPAPGHELRDSRGPRGR